MSTNSRNVIVLLMLWVGVFLFLSRSSPAVTPPVHEYDRTVLVDHFGEETFDLAAATPEELVSNRYRLVSLLGVMRKGEPPEFNWADELPRVVANLARVQREIDRRTPK